MKEIKLHATDNGEIISIAHLSNSYGDQRYFSSLISKFLALTYGKVHIWLSRPDYDVSKLIDQLRKALPKIELLSEPEYFEVSFIISADEIDEQSRMILAKLWFLFQHVSFTFSKGINILYDVKRKAWYEIASELKSFIVFKGIEEDVLWIGKSADLEFDVKSLETLE